jgi:acyl-ACP thioesterase
MTMAAVPQMSELVPVPDAGRVFCAERRAGFGDCAPSGRVRLDGLARWLQDIAFDDVADAGLAFAAVWVVRRTRISVRRFPRFAERCLLQTFCSGLGRMWAERRTTLSRPGEPVADVEAVSLWVHLDPRSWRPCPLSDAEIGVYGEACGQRRVSARLRHPAPEAAAEVGRFRFRATDCDIAGHVNNAAYWAVLEEELLSEQAAAGAGPPPGAEPGRSPGAEPGRSPGAEPGRSPGAEPGRSPGAEPGPLEAELEHRSPAQPGEKLLLAEGPLRWISDPGGEIHASLLLG